ncbi:MAG: hypothetical protein SF182_14765 [Deltaproteobacteria bacterium]|nr:hypothetical protein [Deltaproteobacteria bacterium]
MLRNHVFRLLPATALLTLLAPIPAAHAESLGEQLCTVLKKLLPEVRDYQPAGARAQLVMAVSEAFDYEPDKLRPVRKEIDPATTASCPKEREAMLAVLKTKTLAEGME